MFPFDRHTGMVLEHNAFMDAECTVNEDLVISRERGATEAVEQVVGRDDGTKGLKEPYVDATQAKVDSEVHARWRAQSAVAIYQQEST
jgi:hypothetical protein